MLPDNAVKQFEEYIADDLVIVDDDSMFTALLKRQLRKSNIKYKIFNSSTEAIQYLQQALPHTLLVDLRMPVLDGVQLLETLKDNHRVLPPNIIVCSSCVPPSDVCETVRSLGAQLITKDRLIKKDALLDVLHHG